MGEAASRVVREKGALTLFRGLETSCGREGLYTAAYLGLGTLAPCSGPRLNKLPTLAGPVFGEKLHTQYGMAESTANFVGAIGGGMIAATCSHPLDTIKTCMQGDIERKTYTTLTGTARTLYAEGGYGVFFRGWSFRSAAHCTPPVFTKPLCSQPPRRHCCCCGTTTL